MLRAPATKAAAMRIALNGLRRPATAEGEVMVNRLASTFPRANSEEPEPDIS